MTGLLSGPVKTRPLLSLPTWAQAALPGLTWRSCRFHTLADMAVTADTPQGLVALSVPPDMAHAVDKRRSEYLAGRLCAALALRALGAPEAVGRRGRAPVWPQGVAGSISHSAGRAIAVACPGPPGIGVDCETPMTPQLLAETGAMILAPGDGTHRPHDMPPETFATLAFSAKEAAYKALSHDLTDIPDFREASIAAITATQITIAFRGGRIPVLHGMDGGECITLAIARQVKIHAAVIQIRNHPI